MKGRRIIKYNAIQQYQSHNHFCIQNSYTEQMLHKSADYISAVHMIKRTSTRNKWRERQVLKKQEGSKIL